MKKLGDGALRFPLADEMAYCERVHVCFLLRYCGGNISKAAELAKVRRDVFVGLIEKHGLKSETVAEPQTKAEVIIAQLRQGPKTAAELHKAIGGSYGSLGVYLANLKADGAIKAREGERPFRYSAV